LGIAQERLISSKVWGMELLQAVVHSMPPADFEPYFRPIVINLPTRMRTSETDKFLFTYFSLFAMAVKVDGLTPDYLIGTIK